MTRYRMRTVRKIEVLLSEGGPLTMGEIAASLGKELRTVKNYLNTHPGLFKVVGKSGRANLWARTDWKEDA